MTFVSHTRDIAAYYAASDLFVFPTLYEPFGLVIIEAMAGGLPVITSRLAAAADYIDDGASGILLETPHQPQEMASKVGLLLADSGLRDTTGRRGREVAERFSWDEVARRTLDAYQVAMRR